MPDGMCEQPLETLSTGLPRWAISHLVAQLRLFNPFDGTMNKRYTHVNPLGVSGDCKAEETMHNNNIQEILQQINLVHCVAVGAASRDVLFVGGVFFL